MTVTLWRAAVAEDPHFGRGSYWTRSEKFAQWFRGWLDDTIGGRHVVYRAEVELANTYDVPIGLFIDSDRVTQERIEQLAAAGHLWFSFFERPYQDTTSRQYVYLGTDPIPACREVAP